MADATIDLSELVALAAGLVRAPGRITEGTQRVLTKWGAEGEGIAKRNASGAVLQRRTGDLAQRISFRVVTEGADNVLRLGVLGGPKDILRYAAVHDPPDDRTETTIVPKPPGKVLTIPLDAAKTPAGRLRFTAREAAEVFEDTFWQEDSDGDLILFGIPKGNDASLIPLFAGVPKVTIPARRPIGKAADEIFPKLRADLETTVTSIIRKEVVGA